MFQRYIVNNLSFDLLPLVNTHWITGDVTDVDLLAFDLDLWVFPHHQPATVREEEASLGVMRVSVSLRVFVVHPVIPNPLDDVILQPANHNQGI